VHDIFVQQGATNVSWVWCPNITGDKTTPLSQIYPGDNYVDWTCMDGYNWGTDTNGNYWQTFAQVFGGSTYGGYNHHNTYQELLQLAPSKPIMLGEVASAEPGGSKADWITDMLQTLPTNFPQIKAFIWEEWNEGNSAVTWPIESSPAATAAFANGLSAGYVGNQYASLAAAPIAPAS
jgi:endoglucanase